MPGSLKKLMEVDNMAILCIILAAYCCILSNIIPGTATGSFYKVSRHPARFLAVFSRFNRLTVIYTTFIFKALKRAYRVLKTWIIQHNAPRQGTQERNRHELQPVRIICSPSGVMLSTFGAAQDQPQLEPTNHRNRVH